jgi:hypothetical protein
MVTNKIKATEHWSSYLFHFGAQSINSIVSPPHTHSKCRIQREEAGRMTDDPTIGFQMAQKVLGRGRWVGWGEVEMEVL